MNNNWVRFDNEERGQEERIWKKPGQIYLTENRNRFIYQQNRGSGLRFMEIAGVTFFLNNILCPA